MRHVRLVGLCLIAAFVVSALAAATSSAALPEWGKCVKLPAEINGKVKTKGKYADANCTEKLAPATGEYEFLKGTSGLVGGTEFTNTATSAKVSLETSFGISVNCTGQTARGELSGTKEVSQVSVTFTGCEASLCSFPCENTFAEDEGEEGNFHYRKGEIVTFGLKGRLVYISGAGTPDPSVGLQLEPEEKKGWFAFFGCGPGKAHPLPAIKSIVGRKTYGSNGGDKIVSPITPLNAMTTETTQKYEIKKVENPETHELENEPGIQEPSEINGKPAHLESQLFIEGGSGTGNWGNAAQEETAVTRLNSGEELEIKA